MLLSSSIVGFEKWLNTLGLGSDVLRFLVWEKKIRREKNSGRRKKNSLQFMIFFFSKLQRKCIFLFNGDNNFSREIFISVGILKYTAFSPVSWVFIITWLKMVREMHYYFYFWKCGVGQVSLDFFFYRFLKIPEWYIF